MHILVAPNAFKHSLDARAAAAAIRDGFLQSQLQCRVTCFPIGDGGDGTCALIHERLKGTLVTHTVSGPLGKPVAATYSLVHNGTTAVMEMADASGIRLLAPEERNPLDASSAGTGELIRHALGQGVQQIILGMGGSATVDGGCGILHALGVRFLDKQGKELVPTPRGLQQLHRVDRSGMDDRLQHIAITILCDVENRLLGAEGAATVFGPQKGASPAEVEVLESFLHRLSRIVLQETGKEMTTVPSGGTAGGAAAGLYALANARLVNGIDHFLQLTGFEAVLATADWLVTGEGSLDEQTLGGKGPFGVAQLARQRGIPVIGMAGRVPIEPSKELLDVFPVLLPISHEALTLQEALDHTADNLRRTAQAAGNLMASVQQTIPR